MSNLIKVSENFFCVVRIPRKYRNIHSDSFSRWPLRSIRYLGLTSETESPCYGKLLVKISPGDIAVRISKTDAAAIHATVYIRNPLRTAHFPLGRFFGVQCYQELYKKETRRSFETEYF